MKGKIPPYWIIRCKYCGRISLRQVRDIKKYIFKCPYCKHSTKVKQKNKIGLAVNVLYWTDDVRDALEQVRAYKNKYRM